MSTDEQLEPLPDDLRYSEALAELKGILVGIENESVELDDLAIQVQRAARLIGFCRDRIEKTELSVNKVFETMAGEDAP